ncbi:sugar ABC transporter substrate-binding protein [Agromyces aureus]|uniref:Sugar ABC transporter substrate-binding protein n=1 Tax=Agromyces aureus TaxID=453304 RepID=A0A191WDD8_9MICO|nr:substrate-binding domain-containing protein [Agromyces aureus]ANJ26194.1 sugar ABC transporter substrate-binding protein [Agromyces aureus]
MKKASLISITALAGASMLLLAGCSSSGGDGGSTDDASATRACVILPDAASSPRWENGDRPALEAAITDAGFEADIQNAQGDTSKYATIADQQLSKGCGVMLLVDYNGAAVAVTAKAQEQGIPVIAYDRPIEGADYYVSFDNEEVGALMGQSILDGLATAGKDPATATVVFMGGDPADGNAKMFRDGAGSVLDPAGVVPAQEPTGVWDGDKSATNFEQALTALGGKVDAVWAANDTNAAGVITILDKNGLTVPVSGQDASVAGLQNVLLGKQTATVYKPFQLEAEAASDLAIKLLNGETPTVDKKLDDGTPYIAVTPVLVGPDDVQKVIDDGNADAAEICTDDVAAACAEHGVG